MGSQRSLRDVGELVTSRRFLVAGVALSVVLLAVLVSFFLPRRYESETVVRLLDNDALMSAYGRKTASPGHRAEVVARFREEMTGRDAVVSTVEGLDLDRTLAHLSPAERAARREAIAGTIREGTRVEVLPGKPGEFVFRVTASGSDPVLSVRALTHLVAGYQRRKFAERESGGSSEYGALRDEVAAVERQHAAAAKELADFLEKNEEHRFGQENDTASRLSSAKDDLGKLDRQLELLESRLSDVREQLAEESEWRDVTDGEESPNGKVQNEVWKDLKDTERALVSELAVKKRMRKTLEAKVDELSERVRTFPALSARWQELVRKEKELADKLAELRTQEEEARAAWQEQAAESAVVLTVLDAPNRPGGPAGGERLLVSLVGLVLGLCGGLGSVIVMGLTDKSFQRSDELAVALDVPVLGAIARIETPVEREESKRRQRKAAMTVLVLAVLVGAALVAQFAFDEPISSFLRNTVKLVK